jgi:hypothetical protein
MRIMPAIEALGHGIHAIDTGFVRPYFDASHLVVERGRAAFVDVGPTSPSPACWRRSPASGLRTRRSTT